MGVTADEVTIVVPTKNERDNIVRFLSSIPAGIDVIVVDASEDETPCLIAEHRPDATVVRAPVNIPVARQVGGEMASTEWVLYTDADVLFGPRYFEVLAAVSTSKTTGGIVGTKSTFDGFDRYHRWFRTGQATLSALGIPAATGSNMLVRAETLRSVGGFDPNLSVNEDTELMFRVARSGHTVHYVPELVVVSFDHRRLEMGLARKVAHGAVRNTALYLGLFERRIRAGDWGYWDERPTVSQRR